MSHYHTRFDNLHSEAINAVREATSPLWNADTGQEQLSIMRDLVSELAGIYDMPTPDVRWDDREVYYGSGTIGLPRASVVSLLHEFRHHMQRHGRQANPDIEEDARGWSISLFAEARPDSFDSAWRSGRIMFMARHPGVDR